MIIVEFYGLPSCGKTTTITCLKNNLVSQGYHVGTLPEILLAAGDFKRKWYKLTARRFPEFALLQLISEEKLQQDKIHRSRKALKRIFYEYHVLSKMKDSFDFCLVDQGLIQGLLSVYYDVGINNNTLVNNLLSELYDKIFVEKVLAVNAELSVNEAVDRIIARNKTGKQAGRLDLLSGERLKEVMNVQFQNINIIKTSLPDFLCCFDINMRELPNDNSKKIIRIIDGWSH